MAPQLPSVPEAHVGDGDRKPDPDREVLAFLDEVRDVVLFCRDARGQPIGYPMRTVGIRHQALVFTTYRKSAKVANLERDPRVCVLAASAGQDTVRWVSVSGSAAIVHASDDQIDDLFPVLTPGTGTSPGTVPTPGRGPSPDSPGRVPEGMGQLVRQRLREGKRVLIEVTGLAAPGVQEGSWE